MHSKVTLPVVVSSREKLYRPVGSNGTLVSTETKLKSTRFVISTTCILRNNVDYRREKKGGGFDRFMFNNAFYETIRDDQTSPLMLREFVGCRAKPL
jgi:hypothetical protein